MGGTVCSVDNLILFRYSPGVSTRRHMRAPPGHLIFFGGNKDATKQQLDPLIDFCFYHDESQETSCVQLLRCGWLRSFSLLSLGSSCKSGLLPNRIKHLLLFIIISNICFVLSPELFTPCSVGGYSIASTVALIQHTISCQGGAVVSLAAACWNGAMIHGLP